MYARSDGFSKNFESKLKAMELDFELYSLIKQIENDLFSKEEERDRQITEMKQFLENSAQTFLSKIQSSAQSSQKPISKPSKDGKDFGQPDDKIQQQEP